VNRFLHLIHGKNHRSTELSPKGFASKECLFFLPNDTPKTALENFQNRKNQQVGRIQKSVVLGRIIDFWLKSNEMDALNASPWRTIYMVLWRKSMEITPLEPCF